MNVLFFLFPDFLRQGPYFRRFVLLRIFCLLLVPTQVYELMANHQVDDIKLLIPLFPVPNLLGILIIELYTCIYVLRPRIRDIGLKAWLVIFAMIPVLLLNLIIPLVLAFVPSRYFHKDQQS